MTAENPARRLGTLLARWCVAAFTLDTRSLAAYRIGLGLILVADCLLRTRDFSLMFNIQCLVLFIALILEQVTV